MSKKVCLSIIVILAVIVSVFYMTQKLNSTDMSAINLIKSRIDGRGILIDYDNEIGVKSIDDIGFKIKDSKILLYYGNVEIKIGKKELKDKTFITGLKQIGIEVKKTKDGKIVLLYKGERLEQWVD